MSKNTKRMGESTCMHLHMAMASLSDKSTLAKLIIFVTTCFVLE